MLYFVLFILVLMQWWTAECLAYRWFLFELWTLSSLSCFSCAGVCCSGCHLWGGEDKRGQRLRDWVLWSSGECMLVWAQFIIISFSFCCFSLDDSFGNIRRWEISYGCQLLVESDLAKVSHQQPLNCNIVHVFNCRVPHEVLVTQYNPACKILADKLTIHETSNSTSLLKSVGLLQLCCDSDCLL